MVECPACGEQNPARARFCLSCAAPLPPSTPLDGEERKTVTVLFCDLVGFTARADQADPEDARSLLRVYHEAVRREIERFGGTLEKFIGDAVMAVFGAPTAHEDDAERAVRAALRIIDAVEDLQGSAGLDLTVRIGVNTGEAIVARGARSGEGEGIVAGDVVNTASRLQAAAPEGGVLVGEITHRATEGWIEYAELAPVELKGKAEPVRVWQAVAGRDRQGVDVEQRARTPFLGRGHEMAILGQAFARATHGSAVQLITVSGEPGAGKSRLLWEFRRSIDEDDSMLVFWRQGRCLPYGEGITYWALGEMVKSHAAILESDGPTEAEDKLKLAVSAVVAEPDQAEWMISRLTPLVGSGTGRAEREESFAAWRAFIEAVAAHHPLVLVFEDIHWADSALLEFIEHVVEWSTGVPIVVICTARPELYERSPGWGGGKRNSTAVALAPLSDEDTRAIVAALLSRELLPADVQAALVERAGGNPLFAEEYVRMLLDRGLLRARTEPDRTATEIPLPDTIQATIAARLDTLPAESKGLLQEASVIGKVFWSGAVAAMAGLDEVRVRQMLHDMARKELLRQSRSSSVAGQAEYAFWHALVRDVAYGQIPRAARSRKHRQAAAWIAATAEERVADVAEVLAFHYEQALDLARAASLSDEVAELEVTTRASLQAAGDRAIRLDARKAFAFYRRALDLTLPGVTGRGDLLLALVGAGGISFGGSGELDHDEGDRLLEEAIAEFRACGDPQGAGRAMTELSRQTSIGGDTERGLSLLSEAIRVLEKEPASPELANAQAEMATRHMLANHLADWQAWTHKAIATASQVGADDVYARALQFRGFARQFEGDVAAGDDFREAVRLALEIGELGGIERAVTNQADYVHETIGPDPGWALSAEGVSLLRQRGARAMWPHGESTRPLYALGRWDESVAVAREVMGWDETQGVTQLTGVVLPQLARILCYRGQADEARAIIEAYLPRARETRDPPIYLNVLVAGSVAADILGDRDAAVRSLEEALADGNDWDLRFQICQWTLPDSARMAVRAGAPELAERMIAGPTIPVQILDHQIAASRAEIEEGRGRPEVALRLFLELAPWWASKGCIFEEAQARWGAGRCASAMGDAPSAGGHLERAREILQALGAAPLVAQIEGQLATATAL